MSALVLEGLTRRFGEVAAVDGVNLAVAAGEFLSLLGPSGCGKTTLLRLIAGFERPDAGRILSAGRDIAGLPPHRRGFGVVFQSYALFPHMSVLGNVAYGLKLRGVKRREAEAQARAALERVNLTTGLERPPGALSGGQQQRVALARALVTQPALLLLDEPFSALDKSLREGMQVELRALQQGTGITTIFVTHDQEEALTLSDRVAIVRAGQIVQIGTPRDIYARPASAFVAGFLGTANLLAARFLGLDRTAASVALEGVTVCAAAPAGSLAPGTAISLAIRPEDVELAAAGPGLRATVTQVLFQGHRLLMLLRTPSGQMLRAYRRTTDPPFCVGDTPVLHWAPDAAHLLTPDQDTRTA